MSVVQIKEELTSLERVGLALQRKETDRIPVTPAILIQPILG